MVFFFHLPALCVKSELGHVSSGSSSSYIPLLPTGVMSGHSWGYQPYLTCHHFLKQNVPNWWRVMRSVCLMRHGWKRWFPSCPCLRLTALHLDPQVTVFHLCHHNYSSTESRVPSSHREINGRRKVNRADLVLFFLFSTAKEKHERAKPTVVTGADADLRWCYLGFCCHSPKYAWF